MKFRNFLSYGNYWTDIDLDAANLNILVAKNGQGKSSLVDAIVFGLFGKPYRKINKPNLVNSINGKDLLVEIEFTTGDKTIMVRRGIKPNIFEIFQNGKKLDEKDNTRDQQVFFEDNIIKTNYRTFTQIVILGSSNYVPFMHLSSPARREFIESLLDIDIFSVMNRLLKERSSVLKTLKTKNDSDIHRTEEVIDVQLDMVDKLETRNQSEIDKINSDIQDYQNEISEIDKKIDELKPITDIDYQPINDKRETLNEKADRGRGVLSDFKSSLRRTEKNIKFMKDNTDCPTCHQHIEEDFRNESIKDYKKDIDKNNNLIEDVKKLNTKVAEDIKDVDKELKKYNDACNKIESLQSNYATIQRMVKSLSKKKDNVVQDNLTEEKKKLDSLREKIVVYKEHEELFNNKNELYDAASRLLRDDGIKSLIISQYIPVINKLINRYLEKMNFGVSFTLDENFNEEIKSRYRDKFTYDSFSEGEKQRIDIALLQTWRSVAEMKNSMSTNLLLLDEVFDSSLDGDGMEDYLEILKGVSQKNNIYIISHKLENVASFDRVIRVDKTGDFSYIDYE